MYVAFMGEDAVIVSSLPQILESRVFIPLRLLVKDLTSSVYSIVSQGKLRW